MRNETDIIEAKQLMESLLHDTERSFSHSALLAITCYLEAFNWVLGEAGEMEGLLSSILGENYND